MNNSVNPTKQINTNQFTQLSIFVTSNSDIYTTSINSPFPINRWLSNETNTSATIAYSDSNSYGIFIDINNTLYFSTDNIHKVLSKSLSSSSDILTLVAGTNVAGITANMLDSPHGLFVDVNFDLYVADWGNHRVQLFRQGQQNAITVAGSGSLNVTITLYRPNHVVLDMDKYLFIVDQYNNRIIGSNEDGFHCIVGCTGSSGLFVNTLNKPSNMAFDSFGNIYVVDEFNHRIQKFLRLNNTLSKYL